MFSQQVNKSAGKREELVKKSIGKTSTKRGLGKKTKKTSLTRKALVSNFKKKVDFLTKDVVDISSKFDQLLSTSDQPSPMSAVTFESTDDDDEKSSSSDDFFAPKKTDKLHFSPTKHVDKMQSSTKRDIERIINRKSLDLEEGEKVEEETSKEKETSSHVQQFLETKTFQSKNLDFTESEDEDDDDDDDDDEAEKLKLNQGIKNRILKNCFASLAARHT